MKRIITTIFALTITVVSFAQITVFTEAKDGIKIVPTKLTLTEGNFPIYISILRYNDTTILDIEAIPKNFGSYTENHEVKVGSYYDLTFGSSEFVFSGKSIAPEHLLDLVSNYGFKIKNNILTRRIPFQYWKDYNGIMEHFPPLPKYLTVSIEKVELK